MVFLIDCKLISQRRQLFSGRVVVRLGMGLVVGTASPAVTNSSWPSRPEVQDSQNSQGVELRVCVCAAVFMPGPGPARDEGGRPCPGPGRMNIYGRAPARDMGGWVCCYLPARGPGLVSINATTVPIRRVPRYPHLAGSGAWGWVARSFDKGFSGRGSHPWRGRCQLERWNVSQGPTLLGQCNQIRVRQLPVDTAFSVSVGGGRL